MKKIAVGVGVFLLIILALIIGLFLFCMAGFIRGGPGQP